MSKLDDGENVSPEVRKMVDDNFDKLLMTEPVSREACPDCDGDGWQEETIP